MTQPPSNQPPGGFGAPQDPNQGGTPPVPPQMPGQPPQMPPTPPQPPAQPPQGQPPAQPPQGQPGYGYPQQAPQPGPYGYPQQPQQPGPYGQQPQQPGPYGQQPGPYGQQPGPYAGYPGQTQPMYPPAPAPSGGSGGPSKNRTALVAAVAAAVVAVAAVTTWAVVGKGDDEKPAVANPTASASSSAGSAAPQPSESADEGDGSGDGTGGDKGGTDDLNAAREAGEAKVNFLTTNDVDLPRNGSEVFGPWIVGDTVVKAMYKGVAGYSLADGAKKWQVDLPFKLCATPAQPGADGLMVFGYEESAKDGAKCSMLQQIDLKTGKAGWKKAVPKPTGLFAFSDNTLAIGGNTVTAAGSSSAYGFSLTDGRQVFTGPTGDCKPYAYAGDATKLIAASQCRTGDVNKEQHTVSEVDPNTGKPKWTYKLALTWEVDKVYSVNPLVVSAFQREQKKWSVVALNPNGSVRSQIQGGKDKFAPSCGGGFVIFGRNLQGCTGVAAAGDTFYMATDASYGTSNEVVAFDLKNGKPKWRSKAPEEQQMTPLRMEGGEVLVYVAPKYDKGGAVATIAPAGGAPKILLKHPVSVSQIESGFFSAGYAYGGGTFVVAAGRVSASSDAEEKEIKTMMGFSK
ncbi:PQQ-binding-like beta-propeller repeat protein [Streptomyces sp. NPDC127049]|uniref:outer membrane protein assembly factor BamB family protein n=1 Tax=Streptomyces sp. NPDC127049 TaxID=3347118 RepID=UPI00365AA5FC